MSTAIANVYGSNDSERVNVPQGTMTTATQSREVAEIQGAMTMAKKFPRDQRQAVDRILVACQRKSLAEQATYQYARGGSDISGPSIRLAEAVAREWGNMQFGVRELDQRNGESTVEAFAIDLETNVRCVKVFQVKHERSTKRGNYQITDPRDIYEMVANQGSRRVRACILGVVPGDVIDAAVAQCDETLKADCAPTPERIKGMLDAFEKFGVTREMVEIRIQRKMDAITPAQLVGLRKIYNGLKDGMSTPSDWFEVNEEPAKPVTMKKNASVRAATQEQEQASSEQDK